MKIKTKSYFSQALMALLSLLFLITSVNLLQNIGGGTTDLSENSIAQAPTNTTYWIDETTQTALGVDFDNYTLTQDASASTTTYLIQSETDLAFLSWTIYNNKAYNNHKSGNYFYSGITFKQTKDLDLSAYYWQPIGIGYTRDGAYRTRYFSGKYYGDGHTVSGVYTPAGTGNGYSRQGLFGYVQGQSSTNKATIQNIGVIDSFIQGEDNIGGVVGVAGSATITNCYNTGSVEGTGGNVGGVVGNIGGDVTNCYNTGTVSGVGDRVGGVVGNAYGGDVTNCYNTGSVSGSGEYVGGVVGYASAEVTNCYNTGSVERTGKRVGGVVGYAFSSTIIINCYNTGSVSGNNQVGGVVGLAINHSTITNCYNTGSVSGNNQVGGVMGYAQTSSTITNCYNTGSVSGDSVVGGVVGYADSFSTITNTYYGGDCTLPVGIGDGEGSATKIDRLVEEWAKNEEWYSAEATLDDGTLVWDSAYRWNFETVWNISVVFNGGYPCFDAFWTDKLAQNQLGVDFDNYTLTQDTSTSTTTYLIQSETDLAFLSWTIYNDQVYGGSENKYTSGSYNYFYLDVCFKQTKNLDLSAYYWQPIGILYTRDRTSARRYFSGNYDGGGHTVSGVFTPAGTGSGYSYQGLFGYVNGSSAQLATIQNIGVIGSFVQGSFRVGGVVGEASVYSTITNCYNTGSVNGANEVVGGVVGRADATVSNVYNTGSVSGSSNVGGVVGYASSSSATVSNAYNTGIVSGSGNYVGGVVGNANSLTVSNVYNTGPVSGSYYVGGVVGYAYSATITNVYNTGLVSGNSQVGGVVGRASGSATISDCGVECAVITGTSNVGIFVGYISTGATVENCYAIVEGGMSPYGSNSGTVTNCLWIAGGVKYYLGTDFSGFAWLNTDSCPIPKGLSWMGQFWTGDITNEIMASSEWTS